MWLQVDTAGRSDLVIGETCRTFRYRTWLSTSEDKVTAANIILFDVTDTTKAQEELHRLDLQRRMLQASEAAAQEASRLKTLFVSSRSRYDT